MLYVKCGKIGFMASEEMSFENVDDGRTMDAFLYYKLTSFGLGQLKMNKNEIKNKIK